MFYRRYRQSAANLDATSAGWHRSFSSGPHCVTLTDLEIQDSSRSTVHVPPLTDVTTSKKKKKKPKGKRSVCAIQSATLSPLEKDNILFANPNKSKMKRVQFHPLITTERLNELSASPIRHQILPCGLTEKYNEAKKKLPLLVAIKPANEKSERQRFMRAGYNYNPVFVYRGYADEMEKYKDPSDKYLKQAVLIMEQAISHFGCYEVFEEQTGGKILTKSQIYVLVRKYLSSEELDEEIVVNLRDDLLSRGSMTRVKGKAVLNIRCVNLRENWAEGLLRHEIGTHYLRSSNTRYQPWQSNRVRRELGMGPVNPTEEGLASLHSVLFRDKPYLWRAALLYYTTLMAAKMSFKDLFHLLGQYVHSPEVRWDYCLRAKRGQVDTSRPGSFCKDQVYLEGALQLLKRRRVLDFPLLVRLGKVSWEDVDRESVIDIAQLHKTRIPWFMDDLTVYRRQLDWIAKTNGLTDAVLTAVD